MRRAAALAALGLVAAGCGGGGGGKLTVFAASSLTEAFQKLDPGARFDFGGSGDLAFQIREGAPADVYASASPADARALYRRHLVERPLQLVANQLVLAVPAGNPAHVTGLRSLMRSNVRLVLGAAGVPAGDYARSALRSYCRSIFAKVRTCPRARVVSEEPDVKGVVAKLELGAADAGFVYATDVQAADGKLKALYPAVASAQYAIAIVRRTHRRKQAQRFLARAFSESGQRTFLHAGFVTVGSAGKPFP